MSYDKMIDVKLGLACTEVDNALDQRLGGKGLNELSKSVHGGIKHLTL